MKIAGADTAEDDPDGPNLIVTPVSCAMPNRQPGAPKLSGGATVRFKAGTRLFQMYGREQAEEEYFCNYELNPAYQSALETAGLRICAYGSNGEVRAFELSSHPFFFPTLFQPQMASRPGAPHPLIRHFVEAASNFRKVTQMNQEERRIIETLHERLRSRQVQALIDSKVQLAQQKLARDPAAQMAWEVLPLAWIGEGLPGGVRSAWVFVLRAGATTGAERHPNSRQRTLSYMGRGAFQIRVDDEWYPHALLSDPSAQLDRRWLSIPPNTWHQVVVPPGNGHWAVVSFHTVADHELIEERPDPNDRELTRRKKYAEQTA